MTPPADAYAALRYPFVRSFALGRFAAIAGWQMISVAVGWQLYERTGDPWALGLWTDLSPLLAVALGNAVAILNPERLILGGGLLGRTPTLYAQVTTALMLAAPAASTEFLSIVTAELADDAGLVGSSALAASGVSIVPTA